MSLVFAILGFIVVIIVIYIIVRVGLSEMTR